MIPIAVGRDQAAEMVGLSQASIIRAIQKGDLVEHFPTTSKGVIMLDDLRDWIESSPTHRSIQ